MIEIRLTKQQAEVLVVLIDAGLKAHGARVGIEAGEILHMLRDTPDDDAKLPDGYFADEPD